MDKHTYWNFYRVHSSSPLGETQNFSHDTVMALLQMNIIDWSHDEVIPVESGPNKGQNIVVKHYRRASAHTL